MDALPLNSVKQYLSFSIFFIYTLNANSRERSTNSKLDDVNSLARRCFVSPPRLSGPGVEWTCQIVQAGSDPRALLCLSSHGIRMTSVGGHAKEKPSWCNEPCSKLGGKSVRRAVKVVAVKRLRALRQKRHEVYEKRWYHCLMQE